MKYKTSNLSVEFYSDDTDVRLRAIVREVDNQVLTKFGTELTLTEVWRTEEEEHKLNPAVAKSPHSAIPCRAVDIRSKDLTTEIIAFIKSFVAEHWPDVGANAYSRTRLLENDRGDQFPHIHIAVFPMKGA